MQGNGEESFAQCGGHSSANLGTLVLEAIRMWEELQGAKGVSSQELSKVAELIAKAMRSSPTVQDRALCYSLLANNKNLLKSYYFEISENNAQQQKDCLHNGEEISCSKASQILDTLRINGIAVWDGLFLDDNIIDEATELGKALYDEHIEVGYKFTSADAHKIQAPSQIWSQKGKYHFTGEPDNTQGRYRAHFPANGKQTENQIVNSLFFNPHIRSIVKRYYQAPVREEYFLFETLTPAVENQKFHFDGLTDQMKVMVLLEDVSIDDGPLIFLKKTCNASEKLYPHFEAWFHQAEDHPDTDLDALKNEGVEQRIVTGKKGDCIFFDTLSLHRGSPCTTGIRRNVVLTFSSETLRTQAIRPLIRQGIPQELLK